MRAVLAWLVVAPVALWTVARLLGLERGYPLVPLMSWTPYAAAVSVLVLVVVAVLRARGAAVVALACAVVLVGTVVPRALGGGAGDADGEELRVLTVNLLRGGADVGAVVELARRADVVSFQEIDAVAVRRLRAAGLERELPHAVVRLRGAYGGSALYARRPLRARPVPDGFRNATAVARMDGIELWAVHPPAPVSDVNAAQVRTELRRLPGAGRGRLRILAGDFNATLDHAPLRRLLGRGYADAADAVGAGLKPTWPVGGARWRLPVTIDHVLVDERAGVRSVSVHTVPRSDHRAVLARVVLPSG